MLDEEQNSVGNSMKTMPACGGSAPAIDLRVGARMRAQREQLGMSEASPARAVHVSSEDGEVRPKPAELYAIATVLKVSLSYFFGEGAQF